MATDSSPTADGISNGGGVNNPQSPRRRLPSPWASVVRGDTEQNSSPTVTGSPRSSLSPPAEAPASDNSLTEGLGSVTQPDSSDVNDDSNAGRPRRLAWNRPLNSVPEPVSVMGGAVSWPALSETTRPIVRSNSDISRPVADGSASPLQAPIISQPPQRPATNNVHANSTVNNPMHPRPRSRNSSGGNSKRSGPSQNTFNQPSLPMPPPFPVFEVPYGMVSPMLDTSLRGTRPVGGGRGSQSHIGNDHSAQRNNSMRGSFGPRPRGDGPYHNNHGGRSGEDRRDVHHPPQYVAPPLGYMPSPLPPSAPPFMAPPPGRVFPGPMGFDMASSFIYVPTLPPESFKAMPIGPPPPPLIFPCNENSLRNMIVKQIDFYFSDDNLVRDNFLRSNMDDHGWVPIALIATFNRVQKLTKDIQLILDSLRYSTVVEVQGDKVRRRNEWSKWVLSSGWHNYDSGSRTLAAGAPGNQLATSLQEVSLNDAMTNATGNMNAREVHTETATSRILSDELTG